MNLRDLKQLNLLLGSLIDEMHGWGRHSISEAQHIVCEEIRKKEKEGRGC